MSHVSPLRGVHGTLWLAIAVLLTLMVLPAPTARAESSLGCLLADGATGTGSHMSVGSGMGFNEGEVVTVEVTNPSAETTTATLYADDAEVASGAVPGTLEYVIVEPLPNGFRVEVDGEATFIFGCAEAGTYVPDPPDDPSNLPGVGEFCDSGKAFGQHVSERAKGGEKKGKDGYAPGDDRGFSSCVHGG